LKGISVRKKATIIPSKCKEIMRESKMFFFGKLDLKKFFFFLIAG